MNNKSPAALAAKARYEQKRKCYMTSIRISKKLRDLIASLAKQNDCTIAEMVERLYIIGAEEMIV